MQVIGGRRKAANLNLMVSANVCARPRL